MNLLRQNNMMKKLINFCFLAFLIFPSSGKAVVVMKQAPKVDKSTSNLDAEVVIKLDENELKEKIVRKLKFKEKLAFKLLKRKLKKYKDKTHKKAKIYWLAIVGLVFSLGGLLVTFLGLGLWAVFLGIIGLALSRGALKRIINKPEKKKGKVIAIVGLAIGIIIIAGWVIYVWIEL